MEWLANFVLDLLKAKYLSPLVSWVRANKLLSFSIAFLASAIGFDTYQQMPPYMPTAGLQRFAGINCDKPDNRKGVFAVDDRGYFAAKWTPQDLVIPIYDQQPLGLNQTKSIVLSSPSPLIKSDGSLRYEERIAGRLRNTQFPRIELPIEGYWLQREIQFSINLAWDGLEVLPGAYPGVVAVNVEYWGATGKAKHLVLLSEAVASAEWHEHDFPAFRLPRGTAGAVLRVGLHGAKGNLYIDDAKFKLCRERPGG